MRVEILNRDKFYIFAASIIVESYIYTNMKQITGIATALFMLFFVPSCAQKTDFEIGRIIPEHKERYYES